MRHLIVVCLAFMMGLNVACSRGEDLGKDDLHSEPTIEIVSGDTLDIVGFTLAHELATSEGRLPYNVGDEFGYTGSYTYKSYVVRTEYTYQDDGNSIWVWEDTLSSIIGFYPYLRSEVYDLADVQFHIRSCAQGTVNDALPDNTMHYVPFTYAGTVDAYKLTSAMATTEEYAKNNKYPHSLFVADYAVTKDVSRDALNTAKLIFGKNYASGGVDYTLRC